MGFYFLGCSFPVSCCGTLSDSVHKLHIALQDLHAVALMQCKMALQLSSKVVSYIWIFVLLKLIYVTKVLQHPLFLSR